MGDFNFLFVSFKKKLMVFTFSPLVHLYCFGALNTRLNIFKRMSGSMTWVVGSEQKVLKLGVRVVATIKVQIVS